MKGKKRGPLLLLVLAILIAGSGTVLANSSLNYVLPREVLSGGGAVRSSTHYILGDTMGQPSAIGESQSTSYRLGGGFWSGVNPSIGQNHPPAFNPIGDKAVIEWQQLNFSISATDPDIPAQTLSFSIQSGFVTGMDLNPSTGDFSWTPTNEQGPNVYPVTFRVTDSGTGYLYDEESVTITVIEEKGLPWTVLSGGGAIRSSTHYVMGDTMGQASAIGWSEGAGHKLGGGFWYGVHLSVGQNHPPIFHPVADKAVIEEQTLDFFVSATDTDIPVQTLTFSIQNGWVTGMDLNADTGEFTWTPAPEQGPNVYPVTLRVTDSGTECLFDEVSFSITVIEEKGLPWTVLSGGGAIRSSTHYVLGDTMGQPSAIGESQSTGYRLGSGFWSGIWRPSTGENLPPVADAGGPYNMQMDQYGNCLPIVLDASWSGDPDAPYDFVESYDWDTDNDDLYGMEDDPADYTGMIVPGFVGYNWWRVGGVYIIGLKVTDSAGAVDFDITQVTVLPPPNQPPVAEAGLDRTVEQTSPNGALVSLDGSGSTDDGLPQPLTYAWAWSDGSASGVNPQVSLPPGQTTITLTIYDGDFSASDIVDITVLDTIPPTITAPADITVRQNVSDGAVIGSLGTPAVTDAADPNPVVTNDAPSIFPVGITAVVWKALDASGNSATATQTITVTENHRPSAYDQLVSTDEDAPVAIILAASDIDGDILTYVVENDPAHGTLSGAAPNLTYSPASNYNGPDSFTFRANDGIFDSDVAVISILVEAVNDPPELAPIGGQSVNEGERLTIVLDVNDVDGDSLTCSCLADPWPAGATFEHASRTFSWTPGFDQAGDYNLRFEACDDSLTCGEDITITVKNVDLNFQSFIVKSMTINWGKVVRGKKSPDTFIIFGRLQLPPGSKLSDLTKQTSLNIGIAGTTGTDTVRLKNYPLSTLGNMWSYIGNEQPPGQNLNVTSVNIWWAPSGKWSGWAGFCITGVLQIPGVGINTMPPQAEVTLGIPLNGGGVLEGNSNMTFKVNKTLNAWSYVPTFKLPVFPCDPAK